MVGKALTGLLQLLVPAHYNSKDPVQNIHKPRVDWVDYAKGFCIILVVMMHSTIGVGKAVGYEGFMHNLVAFAKPFRMPDFFLISGLFLARVIDRDWRSYLDKKVVHFAYFYILWVTIQFTVKTPEIALNQGIEAVFYLYVRAFIEPFGTLWFIYLLPLFFVIAKLTRHVNLWVMLAIAAALEVAVIETGWAVIDQTASRFIYFYAGYKFAPQIFKMAARVQAKPWIALLGLVAWGLVNGALTLVYTGYTQQMFMSLILGFLGAAAIVTLAALLTNVKLAEPIRYCGKNSIVIYLAFFLPMHTVRIILLKTGLAANVGFSAFIITTAGIVGPLLIWWLVRNTKLSFLFKRPSLFHIPSAQAQPETALATGVVIDEPNAKLGRG